MDTSKKAACDNCGSTETNLGQTRCLHKTFCKSCFESQGFDKVSCDVCKKNHKESAKARKKAEKGSGSGGSNWVLNFVFITLYES